MEKETKPVALYTVNPFKLDGEHYAVGDVLLNVPAELALELTGAGRTRLASAAETAAAGKKKA
jgi:hypothetical protein